MRIVKERREGIITRAGRAKQFLPFDALKGFQEALNAKQIKYEDKKELTEDSFTKLEEEWNKIDKDSIVKVKYYKNRGYVEIQGKIDKIDYTKKRIQINEENINVCDIIEIEVLLV